MKNIPREVIEKFIVQGLEEDVRNGDQTSLACIPLDQISTGHLFVKDDGVLAGVELAEMIFKYLDPNTKMEIIYNDGHEVDYGQTAFKVTCNSQALLKGERLVLNMMQHMSGIASLSSRFAMEVEGIDVKILDTRKTTPLIRAFEKWAVRIGGCYNYRFGLFDRIMIKDNHIEACGGVEKAITKVNNYLKDTGQDLQITIEVRNLVELYEVLKIGNIDRIMLDNFENPILAEAVAIIDGKFETEASGGVTLRTVRKIAHCGVDYISVGALTHSARNLDLSLKIRS